MCMTAMLPLLLLRKSNRWEDPLKQRSGLPSHTNPFSFGTCKCIGHTSLSISIVNNGCKKYSYAKMLISHSQSFSLFRNLLVISMPAVCLVLMFHTIGNSVHFENYVVSNRPSSPFYQQLYKKTGGAWLAQKPKDEHEPKKRLQWCSLISPRLIGWTNISAEAILKEKDDVVERKMAESGVEPGGKYHTKECQSRNKIAIVVPLRNRTEHLKVFLRYMHPFLQRQQLDYAIIVAEQAEGLLFNRGALMNVGFKEAQLLDNFQCFFFHDVDNLPENDGNPYSCPEDGKPRHMTFSLSRWNNYKPFPGWYFGGVTALTANDFQKINGFSNVYWGWGGEDDDLLRRIKFHKMTPTRALAGYPSLIAMARYKTLSHKKAEPSPIRYKLLREGSKRLKADGLVDLTYKRLALELKPLYTRVFVELQQPSNHTAPGQS